MRALYILTTLALLTASPTAAGMKVEEGEGGVYGFGGAQCITWLASLHGTDKDGRYNLSAASQWGAGYISGRSLTGGAKYKNVIGRMTPDELWSKIESYCRAHPNHKFGAIVEIIVESIGKRYILEPVDFDPFAEERP